MSRKVHQMSTQTIDHAALLLLAESGVITDVEVKGSQGGWGITVRYGTKESTLSQARRKKTKLFKNLQLATLYLKDLGLPTFKVDSQYYEPGENSRPGNAERLKSIHQKAQVQKAGH